WGRGYRHLVSCFQIPPVPESGCMENARKVFDKMPQRIVVSWTAMIGGYVLCGRLDEAVEYFEAMPERACFYLRETLDDDGQQLKEDGPARTSTFDGIVAGCIYTQYTWHLPGKPEDYSVLINKDDVVFGGVKIGKILGNISKAEGIQMDMQEALARWNEYLLHVHENAPEFTDSDIHDELDMIINYGIGFEKAEKIGFGLLPSPEDLAVDGENKSFFTGCGDGWIKRVWIHGKGDKQRVENWAFVGGRTLGVALGPNQELIVCELTQ
ncbi:hypothetical protein KI387_028310, partial [Taxus chinensis]